MMAVPHEISAARYAELMVTLPPDWRLDQKSLENEQWYWPIRMLKSLARLPHLYATWLGPGHSVPNGDPAEPYAPGTKLCGAIVVRPVTVRREFALLEVSPTKHVAFYSVVPIFSSEMRLKLDKGSDALFELMDARKIDDVIDPQRKNVARKWLGLF